MAIDSTKTHRFSVIARAFSNLQQANVRIILSVGVIALK